MISVTPGGLGRGLGCSRGGLHQSCPPPVHNQSLFCLPRNIASLFPFPLHQLALAYLFQLLNTAPVGWCRALSHHCQLTNSHKCFMACSRSSEPEQGGLCQLWQHFALHSKFILFLQRVKNILLFLARFEKCISK